MSKINTSEFNEGSTSIQYNFDNHVLTVNGRDLKSGIRYLHPKYREVIMLGAAFKADWSLTNECYVATNSGEKLRVKATELGSESPNQGRICIGCHQLTEPLRMHPHRRKCRRCVRRETRIRKGGNYYDQLDMHEAMQFQVRMARVRLAEHQNQLQSGSAGMEASKVERVAESAA